uniref:TF-B3 domain-containing protein n=1 Tax=Solanum lycopersicum TaxID=4081 RepID=A0A3Q7FJJ9_SOLLC
MTTHSAHVQGHQMIKKTVTQFERSTKLLVLPFAIALEYVFRHLMKEMVQLVEKGNILCVQLWDVTDDNNHKNYENTYVVKMEPCEDYAIYCDDLFENCELSYGDEIEIYWDSNTNNFKFKLIN